MDYDKYGFRDCCNWSCKHDYPYTVRKPAAPVAKYTVRVVCDSPGSSRCITEINKVTKEEYDRFIADWGKEWTHHNYDVISVTGEDKTASFRTALISSVTFVKES